MGGISRILAKRREIDNQAATIADLQAELEQLKTDHSGLHDDLARLQTDHASLQDERDGWAVEQEVSGAFVRSLQTQMAEQNEATQGLEAKAADLDRRLAAEVAEREKVAQTSAETIRLLQQENERLKGEALTLVADSRPAIIAEYRRSVELRDEVVEQFGRGYAFAKSLVVKAGINPIVAGLSSDEDVSEGEGEPSEARNPPNPPSPDPPL